MKRCTVFYYLSWAECCIGEAGRKEYFRQMADLNHKDNWQISQQQSFYQMSLFDDCGISGSGKEEER